MIYYGNDNFILLKGGIDTCGLDIQFILALHI